MMKYYLVSCAGQVVLYIGCLTAKRSIDQLFEFLNENSLSGLRLKKGNLLLEKARSAAAAQIIAAFSSIKPGVGAIPVADFIAVPFLTDAMLDDLSLFSVSSSRTAKIFKIANRAILTAICIARPLLFTTGLIVEIASLGILLPVALAIGAATGLIVHLTPEASQGKLT